MHFPSEAGDSAAAQVSAPVSWTSCLLPREHGLGQQRSDGHSKPGLGTPEVTGAVQHLLSRKELFGGVSGELIKV